MSEKKGFEGNQKKEETEMQDSHSKEKIFSSFSVLRETQKSKAKNDSVLVKGPWAPEEDEILLEWIKRNGPKKWSTCAMSIIGRSGKQCRERWMNSLNPDVKKGEWTAEEQHNILEGYKNEGCSWSSIARRIPSRTENSIKNYFYSTIRKFHSGKMASLVQAHLLGPNKDRFDLSREIIEKFSNNLNVLGLDFLHFLGEKNTPQQFTQAKRDLLALLTTKPKKSEKTVNLRKRSHKASRGKRSQNGENEETSQDQDGEPSDSDDDDSESLFSNRPNTRITIEMFKPNGVSDIEKEYQKRVEEQGKTPSKSPKKASMSSLEPDQGNEKNYMVKSMDKNQKLEMLKVFQSPIKSKETMHESTELKAKEEAIPNKEEQKKKRKYTKKKKVNTDFLKMLSLVPSHNEQSSGWSLANNRSGFEYPLFLLPSQRMNDPSTGINGFEHQSQNQLVYPIPEQLAKSFPISIPVVQNKINEASEQPHNHFSRQLFQNQEGNLIKKQESRETDMLDVHEQRKLLENSKEKKSNEVGDFLADLFSGFKLNSVTLSQCPACLHQANSNPKNGFVKRSQPSDSSPHAHHCSNCQLETGMGPFGLGETSQSDIPYREVVFSMLNELKNYLTQSQVVMNGNGLGFPIKNRSNEPQRNEKMEEEFPLGDSSSHSNKRDVNIDDQIDKIAKIKDILIQQSDPSPVQVENLLFKKLMEIEQIVLNSGKQKLP